LRRTVVTYYDSVVITQRSPNRPLAALLAAAVLALTALLPSRALSAQVALRGVVFDSLAKAPLKGALVQLVGSEPASAFGQTVVSNALGQFELLNVPAGAYTLGFYHPMLDSLGMEPIARTITLGQRSQVEANLAIPSAAVLRAAICGRGGSAELGGFLIGRVRSARDGEPIGGVLVQAEWMEYTIGAGEVERRTPSRADTTNSDGFFALCNVPAPGAIAMLATRGADSTDVIELETTGGGFLRRELFLGEARVGSVTLDTTTTGRASGALVRQQVHVGDGRVSGVVLTKEGTAPLAGAVVRLDNGPQARTNAQGEWSISNAPAGTRRLEIRAVGHYPERRTVDVIDGAPPVRVAMLELTTIMASVNVTAARDASRALVEFEARRKSAFGRFLTRDDIERRRPVVTSDMFRAVQGVFLDGVRDSDQRIQMRGIFDARCDALIFVNGGVMPGLSAADLDDLAPPRNIIGIEVYQPGTVPAEFQQLSTNTSCGVIAVWTTR
jgi:hypothetical protein